MNKFARLAKYIFSYLRNSNDSFLSQLDTISAARPVRVSVACTDRCNANCVFCARQYVAPIGEMSPQLFDLILKKYTHEVGGGKIGLGVAIGEPLLDRHFWSRFDAVRQYGLSMVGFVTNFIHARKVGIERLLREGPPGVAISFCPDRDLYQRTFRNRCYDTVLENIVELATLRKVINPAFWIAINIRSAGPRSRIMASPDFARLQSLLPERDLKKQICNRYDNWNGQIRTLPRGMHLSSSLPVKVLGRRVPCAQLYGLLCFLPNGAAVGCACRLVRPSDDLCVGNIQDSSFVDLWHRVIDVRRRWRKGKVPNCCRNCSMYMPVTMHMDLERFRREYAEVDQQVPCRSGTPTHVLRRAG